MSGRRGQFLSHADSVEADLDVIERSEECGRQLAALRRILDEIGSMASDRATPSRARLMQQRAIDVIGGLANSGCLPHGAADDAATGVAEAVRALESGAFQAAAETAGEVLDRLPSRTARVMESAGAEGQARVFEDGSIRFTPPFSKEAADYRRRQDGDFDRGHGRCEACVHYIEGGGCHFVQGEIDPLAYCAEFFSDYGMFAHDHGDYVEVNAELVSPEWDYDGADIRDLVDAIEERLQQRSREQRR